MDREVDAMGYGICIFSADTVQDFLKREKIRKRKLLSLLQKDKELYLSTQKEGILIPLVGINAYNYAIRLEGRDEPFDDRWVQKKTLKKIMWCDDDTIKPYFTEAGRNIAYGNLKRQLQSPCFCGFAEKIKKIQKKLKKVLDIYAIIVL